MFYAPWIALLHQIQSQTQAQFIYTSFRHGYILDNQIN